VASIAPGEEKTIDIYGLFTKDVLDITEGSTVSANIRLIYTLSGKETTKEYLETIKLQNRNALTWDDDRKAAAFVTAKDPAVLKFAKNTASAIAAKPYRGLDRNLLLAMALHEALDLYGVTYVVDPNTPYVEFAGNKTAVDYLQFPRQTLEFLAGDCDDLSILYTSLLEAVGVETAFVTVPGHIYTAFALAMNPDEARKFFLYPDDLIYEGGKAWVPVEITSRKQGFVKAWTTGAKEWRENQGKGQTGFIPVRGGWQIYEAVGMPGTTAITSPGTGEILGVYAGCVDSFIQRETEAKAADVQAAMAKTQDRAKGLNSLGVLYARYGMDDKAEANFKEVLTVKEYAPALVNLGNLFFLKSDYKGARTMYERADKVIPNNAAVLVGIARANHELENYGSVKEAYDKLKTLSPDLAAQFSYLALRGDEANRAVSKEAAKEAVVWAE
jgi:tetratricopeptide (TPR) repeat protein